MEQASFILDNIEAAFDSQAIAAKLGLRSARAEDILNGLIGDARPLAKPKAALKVGRPEIVSATDVELAGVAFKSELLSKRFKRTPEVFPYLATEGVELYEWAASLPPAKQGFADGIRYAAMKQALLKVEEFILESFNLELISEMNPGSLPIWPLVQQKPLFELLAPLPGQIGVTLLPSFLMHPGHTVSGIFFPTKEKYYNCQLCQMEACPNRKAPYRGLAAL